MKQLLSFLGTLPGRIALFVVVLGIAFLFYKCSRPVKQPQDVYGNNTIDTRRERKGRAQTEETLQGNQLRNQFITDSIAHELRTKKRTPVTPAAVRRADSILRADLGR